MRIDVEVYKGPLSKEPMVQFGDLLGFLDEVSRGLKDMRHFTNAVVLNKDFDNILAKQIKDSGQEKIIAKEQLATRVANSPKEWCDGLDAEGAWDQIDYFDCVVLKNLRNNNDQLSASLNTYKRKLEKALINPNRGEVENLLLDLSKFTGTMRKNPFSWAIPGAAGLTPNFKVRIAMVVYIVAMAEYGNQLHARIDALMKQLDDGGFDRRELPLSVYISDTEPTDFVHLFDLWDAAADRSWAWLTVAAIDGTVKDRINMVKRLFADHHWSKINTAYASGWGKTKMAFIKDDIGNWNLKSFDNAPEELLNAYTVLAKTALDKAATLAMDINTGGSASTIDTLIKLSRNVSMPSNGDSPNSSMITELHHRADQRLREAGWAAIGEEAKLTSSDEQKKIQRKLMDGLLLILQDHSDLVDLAAKPVSR